LYFELVQDLNVEINLAM